MLEIVYVWNISIPLELLDLIVHLHIFHLKSAICFSKCKMKEKVILQEKFQMLKYLVVKIHKIIDPVKTKNSHSYTLTL